MKSIYITAEHEVPRGQISRFNNNKVEPDATWRDKAGRVPLKLPTTCKQLHEGVGLFVKHRFSAFGAIPTC